MKVKFVNTVNVWTKVTLIYDKDLLGQEVQEPYPDDGSKTILFGENHPGKEKFFDLMNIFNNYEARVMITGLFNPRGEE